MKGVPAHCQPTTSSWPSTPRVLRALICSSVSQYWTDLLLPPSCPSWWRAVARVEMVRVGSDAVAGTLTMVSPGGGTQPCLVGGAISLITDTSWLLRLGELHGEE